MGRIPVWMDCDPGHDDAFALLLAAYSPQIQLLGVSIVHGNDAVEACGKNAERFLWTSGVEGVRVHLGASRPLVREPKYCPEIHGTPGQDGVSGMCGFHFPDDLIFSNPQYQLCPGHGVLEMKEALMTSATKVTIVATGAQTNLALALRLYPELKGHIERIVFMGGAIGLGNTGVAAEFNIEIDPEAAHIVLHSGIPIVMIPLEVTHSILVTDSILNEILHIHTWAGTLSLEARSISVDPALPHPHVEYPEISKRVQDALDRDTKPPSEQELSNVTSEPTPFASCCFQLLSYFKKTYKDVFSFSSPPLHDPATILYLTHPEAFVTLPMFVDVELGAGKCAGRTLCDLHGIHKRAPNVLVCTSIIDVDLFWTQMLGCIQVANSKSPLNVIIDLIKS